MLDTRYDHKNLEDKIYKLWEKSGYFNPDRLPKRRTLNSKPFCIIMPPPNANGALHMGHAVGITLEDIMTRFERMRGKRTLWLPGADHAGFETQVVFDKKLDKEGRNRHKIPREKLWTEIWNFTQKNKETMQAQTKKLGASCDWSRETFTLDPKVVDVVYETFEKMHRDGLVYRDLKVVNWCPKHQTALSDLEVKYVERNDPLYHIKYGPLTLATVRPETKFGDTALAVNPHDKRYRQYIGKTIEAKGILGPLKFKVIADKAVDPKFGTGVVKITPAHDATDFEIWTRHKDEIPGPKVIIDERGCLTGEVGEFKGLKIAEAREKIAEKMREIGILEKIEPDYIHQVATCYKCGSTLEPIPKPQWFVKMKPLAEPAIKALKAGKFRILPKRSEKVYLHWLRNIRDWNISRQIIWGIRIPAWFRGSETKISKKRPGPGWEQDPDVFDTWFSSGQWPYATLQIRGGDFKNFYPTDVMETGYDILFFWVARMVMLGLYRTGKVPFKTVYLHGLVRDKDRQKMSKSKGNVIDPLGVADLYGTDAVRMALTVGNTAGNDIVISEDKIRGYRNFATKVWNIARFVLMNKVKSGAKPKFTAADRKHLSYLKRMKTQVTKHLERFEFHLAAEKIYHYIWHEFADKIIEAAKPRLKNGKKSERLTAYKLIETILTESVKMLHPFMPFVTEEIYQNLPSKKEKVIMVENW
ncbi:MAG TPA: valine--tRNA ligase [Candidatus Paceibacterota bacterium]|nr:valine--tRNA ligase [Candidatus Paceibacterota bacterium]